MNRCPPATTLYAISIRTYRRRQARNVDDAAWRPVTSVSAPPADRRPTGGDPCGGRPQSHRRRRPAPGFQIPASHSTPVAGPTATAVGATIILVLFLASGLRLTGNGLEVSARTSQIAMPAERVFYAVTEPAPQPPPAEGAIMPTAAEPPRTVRRPSLSAPPGGRSPAMPDSVSPVAGTGLPVRPSTVELPRLSPEPASSLALPKLGDRRAPIATCDAPCGDALVAGPLTGPAGLDSASRTARLRELGESVPELAREGGSRLAGGVGAGPTDPGGPPVMSGGIGVPLPGGGPSRAQRARDRKLHAQNMRMMARVRARVDPAVADSLARADSVARADSLRADSLTRPRRPSP